MKGYLWNRVYTDLSGNTYNDYVITTSVTPTNESRYGYVGGIENGKYMVQCSEFNNIICGLTVDEITEFSRVDYNHTSGNKVVIDTNATSIVSVTDDFDAGPGATFEFHFVDGRTQSVVVGEQVPDYGEEWIFNNYWTWTYGDSGIRKPSGSGCYVKKDGDEWKISCIEWKISCMFV